MPEHSTPTTGTDAEEIVRRHEIFAWACFDFANSGYTTVILTTVYSAYFVAVIAAGLDSDSPGSATLLWTLAIAAANLIVLLSAPVIGAIADHHGRKKPFLLVTTIVCVLATAALSQAGPEQLVLAVALLIISAVAYASGENLIAAFLPEISRPEDMGRISGYGWSFGYFGGLLTLAFCLAYISWAQKGGAEAIDYVPVTLIITAVVFALAATPTFRWLRERAQGADTEENWSYLRAGTDRVLTTLRHAAHLPDLFRFLGCLILFQAGVSTVVVVAAIYAQEVMGFDSSQLITLIMLVNLTAAAGAFIFGYAQDHWGSVPSLVVALLVWIAAIGVALYASTDVHIWLAGNLIGLAMGATQAGGRALIGRMTPVARNAEVFGLWGLANRAAAIIGPVSYGVITNLSKGDHQLALISTLLFFIAGLCVLVTVDEKRGMAAAASLLP